MLSRSTATRAPGVALRSVARISRAGSLRALPTRARAMGRQAVIVASGDGDERKEGKENDPVASEFMKELQRRGMNAEGAEAKVDSEKETAREAAEDLLRRASGKQARICQAQGSFGQRPAAPQWAKGAGSGGDDQLARSRALNSEGLEGLIPRGTELLKLGFSSVLAFWPFIAGIAVIFTLTFNLFGTDFIHGGEIYSYKATPYIVPEGLLAEPTVDPFVRFDKGV